MPEFKIPLSDATVTRLQPTIDPLTVEQWLVKMATNQAIQEDLSISVAMILEQAEQNKRTIIESEVEAERQRLLAEIA